MIDSAVETETAVSPTGRTLWHRGRLPALLVVAALLAAILIAAVTSGGRLGSLDPDSVSATGSKALAQILRGQGVEVVRAQGIAAATQAQEGDTLVIPGPDYLTVTQAKELISTGADLVVVGATRPEIITTFAPGVSPRDGGPARVRDPSCSWSPALRAGNAETGGTSYRVAPEFGLVSVSACYPIDGDPTILEALVDGQRVVLIGAPDPLENDRLPVAGNAALALSILGVHPRVVWHVTSVDDFPVEAQKSFWQLVPTWVKTLLIQLGLALVLMALWRARRLGGVVSEPLPVVVRAAEATEGRGRLYRRAGARGRAAERLRVTSRSRLAPLVGLDRAAAPAAVVQAVAGRAGRPEGAVHELLYGDPPSDDAGLVALADRLDSLEREVRDLPPHQPRIR